MSSNTSDMFREMTEISSQRSIGRIAGWVVFGLGGLYMLLVGWLHPGWLSPPSVKLGSKDFPDQHSFIIGNLLLLLELCWWC